jgi:trehalose 6-phosphate synthase/phosphatase
LLISSAKYDFIMALGDDNTDEDLFKVIPRTGFTVKVGCNPTNARFNIRDQSQIYEILTLLIGTSELARR